MMFFAYDAEEKAVVMREDSLSWFGLVSLDALFRFSFCSLEALNGFVLLYKQFKTTRSNVI